MRFSKYIIAAIFLSIIAIVTVICNGCFVLEEATSRNYVNVESEVVEIQVAQLDAIARKHHLLLYGRIEETTSLRDETITYYVYDDQKEALQNDLGYHEGIIEEVIDFSLQIRFASLKELETNLMLANTVQNWCLLGSEADFTAFYKEVRDLEEYTAISHKAKLNIVLPITYGLMAFSLLLLLLYCHIENAREKKQTAISIIHGASGAVNYFQKSVAETVVFSMLFIASQAAVRAYTQIARPFSYLYIPFVVFIVALWLVNLGMLRFNAKEVLYGYQQTKRIMAYMHGMVCAVSCLSCAVILIILSVTPSIRKNIKAEPFFQQNRDRVFVRYVYKDAAAHNQLLMDDDQTGLQQMWQERDTYFNEMDDFFEPICVADCSRDISIGLMNAYQEHPLEAIYCNFRAKSYIESYVPQIKEVSLDEYDCIILIPEQFSQEEQDDAAAYLKERFTATEGYVPEHIYTCLYHANTEILCFNYYVSFEFLYFENPSICIASNTLARASVDRSKLRHVNYQNGFLYKEHTQEELDAYFEAYTFQPVVYNAYEKFRIDYRLEQTFFFCNVIMIILLLLFYISVQRTIIQLDYRINAIELAVKKILGYSIPEKNRRYFHIMLLNTILNLLISIVYALASKQVSVLLAIAVVLSILLLEATTIYILIRKIESAKLPNILKGGAL